jgi:RNA polymerase sigma-70 factor (ECF subfamily)
VAGPVVGAARVAAFVASVAPRGAAGLATHERDLNGQPAIVVTRDGQPTATIQLSVADGRVRAIFIQADPQRLNHLADHGA